MTTSDDLELDLYLRELGEQRFVNHEMGVDRSGPNVVGFVREWSGGTADVVVLYDHRRACAWRTETGPGADVFAPELVSWFYQHVPVWTLRAMLALPPPGDPEEPRWLSPLPDGWGVAKDGRLDMRVRMRPR